MRILFVHSEPDYLRDNPYVYSLVKGLKSQGCTIDCSLEQFWSNYDEYDIFHFQWPESIFNWEPVTNEDVEKLAIHLSRLLNKKKKIVYTRHNIVPHYSTNEYKEKLYKLLERESDVILHMGVYSLTQLKSQITDRDTRHFIVPHHTYDEIYTSIIDKESARKRLKIKNDKFVFLCFGAFRNKEERKMVYKSFSKLKYPKKLLVAPRFFKYKINIKHPRALIKGIIERLNYFSLSNDKSLSAKFIDNQMLPYYFSSADVIFIQRCQILNSGNIPMAFHFCKTVIGANTGNVGELLKKSDNIVFNPSDFSSIVDAMERSMEKVNSGQGTRNKEYAKKYLNTKEIARQIKQIYISILE
ncbi:MAG: hypothetical protein PETM_00107 [Petrimonas sp.]|jgi:hypothetical protein|uniref:hypothetical protein n=1 Tax=Petrimonas sp. TaxID=2023866 RepID=UPI0030CB90F8